ncbi:MAG: 50S ribosomal protein L32 [Bdellovibrionota bacterium]
MAHPSDKMTRSKRGMRRSHDFLVKPGNSTCANCGTAKKPHIVCKSCGHYKGRLVVAAKQ